MRDENDAGSGGSRTLCQDSIREHLAFVENVRQYKWIKDVLARRRQCVIGSLGVAQQNIEYVRCSHYRATAVISKQCHVAEDCLFFYFARIVLHVCHDSDVSV